MTLSIDSPKQIAALSRTFAHVVRRVATSVAFLSALALVASSDAAAAATCDQFNCVTMHDTIPNFAGQPTIRSLKSGNWSSASTWNLGRVPTASDIVSIAGGTTVTIDGTSSVAAVIGIEALGKLAFRTDVATRLTVGTLQVLPQGTLEVGTAATPINAAVTAEIRIADRPLDLTDDGIGVFDPRQFGTGLVSIDGKVTMHGTVKTPYERLATEPKRGDLTLTLAAPVSGWKAGDRIFLPDSKPVSSASSTYTYEGEEMTVSSVSTNGLTVYLAAALLYGHPGGRDGNDVLEFLPHVGNVSRNILIQSANPAGTRGHMFYTERSEVDVRYVNVHNMGRATVDPIDSTTFDSAGKVVHMGTNHIGRYPLHLHHVLGPVTPPASGHQFTLLGNAVDDDATINRHKWAMTIHASHYGQIDHNVIYNAGGWGIGTEDGSESFNEFTSNFIAKVRGEGGRELPEAGNGLWLRGPNNYVRDNVIANIRGNQIEGAHGIQFFFKYLGNICVPNFPGADMSQCTTKNGNQLPLLEVARNEVYGAMEIGLAIWWLGTSDYTPLAVAPSTVKDFRAWNFTLYGYYGYTANQLTFDGFVARGRKSFLSNVNEFVTGIWFGDYMNQDVVIRNADIQNLRIGIIAPYFMRGSTLIEDSYLRNAVNIRVNTIGAPGSQPVGANMPPKQTIISNVSFAAVNGSVSTWGPYDIDMNYTLWNGSSNLVKRDAVYVYGFNKVAGDDFQVFYSQQDPNFVVPQSSGNLVGSSVAGLTNAQNWSKYGLAIANEVATNTTTRTGINGLVRLGTPQLLPGAPTITSVTPTTSTLSVAFVPGSSGSSSLTNYEYSTNGGVTWVRRSPASTSNPVVIGGLTAGTAYAVELRAVNANGSSAATPPVQASTQAALPFKLVSFSASRTSTTVSTPVVFTASATGGTGTYEYRFDLYNAGTGAWTRLQNYSTAASVTWTPAAAGTYWVQVWGRSVGSSSAWEDWRNSAVVTVAAGTSPAQIGTLSASSTNTTISTPVVFTASATGGSGSYEYRFALYDAGHGTWTVLQNYATPASVTWTPSAAGTFWVQVWVRSVGSSSAWEDWRNSAVVTVAATTSSLVSTPASLTTYTASRTSTTVASPVAFTAAATGGSGTYEYRFDLYNAGTGTWTPLQSYSGLASVTWTPSVAGTYWVQVWVRCAGSSSAWEDWRNSVAVTVVPGTASPAQLATLTASRTSTAVSTPVVFTASATGGSGSYEYRFALYDAGRGTWTVLQNYATPASVTWTPSSAGTFWVQVWVRSVGSSSAWEDWRNSAVVTVTGTTSSLSSPASLATYTTSRTSTTIASPVMFTASATGGTGSYEYRFDLYNAGTGTWTRLQSYAGVSSITWTPAAAGTYWVQVWVRSMGSTSMWEDWRNSDVVTVVTP